LRQKPLSPDYWRLGFELTVIQSYKTAKLNAWHSVCIQLGAFSFSSEHSVSVQFSSVWRHSVRLESIQLEILEDLKNYLGKTKSIKQIGGIQFGSRVFSSKFQAFSSKYLKISSESARRLLLWVIKIRLAGHKKRRHGSSAASSSDDCWNAAHVRLGKMQSLQAIGRLAFWHVQKHV
jgi:hypothetical protein